MEPQARADLEAPDERSDLGVVAAAGLDQRVHRLAPFGIPRGEGAVDRAFVQGGLRLAQLAGRAGAHHAEVVAKLGQVVALGLRAARRGLVGGDELVEDEEGLEAMLCLLHAIELEAEVTDDGEHCEDRALVHAIGVPTKLDAATIAPPRLPRPAGQSRAPGPDRDAPGLASDRWPHYTENITEAGAGGRRKPRRSAMNRVTIDCPACGHRIDHRYEQMDATTELECPACGHRFNVARHVVSELGKGLGAAAKAITESLKPGRKR